MGPIGPNSDEIIGEWRKLHSEELHNLYSSPIMIKPRRIRWAEHLAHMGTGRMHTRFVEKARRKETSGKIQT
jgi:hypothetical protein